MIFRCNPTSGLYKAASFKSNLGCPWIDIDPEKSAQHFSAVVKEEATMVEAMELVSFAILDLISFAAVERITYVAVDLFHSQQWDLFHWNKAYKFRMQTTMPNAISIEDWHVIISFSWKKMRRIHHKCSRLNLTNIPAVNITRQNESTLMNLWSYKKSLHIGCCCTYPLFNLHVSSLPKTMILCRSTQNKFGDGWPGC